MICCRKENERSDGDCSCDEGEGFSGSGRHDGLKKRCDILRNFEVVDDPSSPQREG